MFVANVAVWCARHARRRRYCRCQVSRVSGRSLTRQAGVQLLYSVTGAEQQGLVVA